MINIKETPSLKFFKDLPTNEKSSCVWIYRRKPCHMLTNCGCRKVLLISSYMYMRIKKLKLNIAVLLTVLAGFCYLFYTMYM